jgi:GAF domain-containing protein
LGFIRDITEDKRAEQLRSAQDEVLELIGMEPTLEDAAPQVLEIVGTRLGWRCGAFWRVDPGRRGPHCIHFWKDPSTQCPDLERASRLREFGPDQDLVGQVWQSGDAEWIEDVLHEPDMPRALPALRAGLHAAVAVPILGGGEVRGVLELFADDPRPEQPDVLHRLYDLGRRMGRLPSEDQLRRSRSLRSRIIRRLW